MPHRSITHVTLSAQDEWDEARLDLQRRTLASAGVAPEGLELIRVDDRCGVLIVAHPSHDEVGEFLRGVVDAWLAARGAQGSATRVRGDVIFEMSHRDDDEIELLDDEARTRRFVEEVSRTGTVWSLYGETWVRSTAAGEVEALPFWSRREQAVGCIAGPWDTFTPRSIELPTFLDAWLTGMQEDGLVAVLLPTRARPGAIVEPASLAAALRRDA
jgi:hypothetical protein